MQKTEFSEKTNLFLNLLIIIDRRIFLGQQISPFTYTFMANESESDKESLFFNNQKITLNDDNIRFHVFPEGKYSVGSQNFKNIPLMAKNKKFDSINFDLGVRSMYAFFKSNAIAFWSPLSPDKKFFMTWCEVNNAFKCSPVVKTIFYNDLHYLIPVEKELF